MNDIRLITLELLLKEHRDDAVDREEWDKRESLRFDVEFEIKARGLVTA